MFPKSNLLIPLDTTDLETQKTAPHLMLLILGNCLALLLSGCMLTATAPQPTAIPSGSPAKPQDTIVSLTFDDGDSDNFKIGSVLKQYGLHATFYIPSGLVGRPDHMTWMELQTLRDNGNEIGGHTLDHVNIGGLDPASLKHEICDDRQNLIAHGFQPVSFAYPFGGYDAAAKQEVKECGYSNARTIGGGPGILPVEDPYELLSFPYILSDTNLDKLVRYIGGTRKAGGGWIILIFHHVCDTCDYFSIRPDILDRYMPWLAGQKSAGIIKVETIQEVMLGRSSP